MKEIGDTNLKSTHPNIRYGFGTFKNNTYFLSIQLWDRCTMYRLFNSTEYWMGLVLARKLRKKIENWERDGLNFLPQ